MKKKIHLALITVAIGLIGTVAYSQQQEIITRAFDWGTVLVQSAKAIVSDADNSKEMTLSQKGQNEVSNINGDKSVGQNKTENSEIPDYITFDILFNMVGQVDKEADRMEAQGKNGKIWRDYFKDRAGLTSNEVNKLKAAAKKFIKDLEPVHNRAMEIITARRAKFPNGQMRNGENPPEPTPELKQLQQKRQEIVLQNRDYLESELGSLTFNRLRTISQRTQAGNTRVLDEDAVRQLQERTEKDIQENKMSSNLALQGGNNQ